MFTKREMQALGFVALGGLAYAVAMVTVSLNVIGY